MLGEAEDSATGGSLHNLTRIHHHHLVADLRHDPEIVSDEDDGGAGLLPQPAHEPEDLGLDRDVERRGGLVGDEEMWVERERHGDHHALAHAARELVGIFVESCLRGRDAHAAQHVDGSDAASRRDTSRWRTIASAIWSPTV
jgi:hypothetical protein